MLVARRCRRNVKVRIFPRMKILALALLISVTLLRAAQADDFEIKRTARHVTRSDRNAVLSAAGIPAEQRKFYVVDHIIPLELGGTNDLSNLQPQLKADGRKKDRVENFLASQVRKRRMTVADAQRAILHWRDVAVPSRGPAVR